MITKRRLLIAAALSVTAITALLLMPYPRQFVFGPKLQGIPLCAWQDHFRQLYEDDGGEKGLIGKVFDWLRRGRSGRDWATLDEAGWDVLLESLADDPNPKVRKGIAEHLRDSVSPRQPAILVGLLDDSEVEVVEAACKWVETDQTTFKAALPKLTGLLTHGDPKRRMLGVRTLGENYHRSRPIPIDVLQALAPLVDDADEMVRLAALGTIPWARKRGMQFAVHRLSGRLNDDNPKCRVLAATAVRVVTGDCKRVVGVYLDALRQSDNDVRLAALNGMTLDRACCLAAWDELVACARNNAFRNVQQAAIRSLRHGGRKAVPELIRLLNDKATADDALFALTSIGPDAQEAVPLLLPKIRELGAGAVLALERMKAKDALPVLIELLHEQHDDRPLRWQLIHAVGTLGLEAATAEPRLWDLLSDSDKSIRGEAMVALARIGADSKRLLSSAKTAFRDDDPITCGAGAEALAELSKRSVEARDVLIAALKTDYGFKTRIAIIVLGEIGPEAKAAVSHLIPLLSQGHWLDRENAAQALAKIHHDAPKVIPALIPLLAEEYQPLRVKVIRAIASFGPTAKDAVPALTALLNDDDIEVSEAAADALRAINPDRYGSRLR